MTEVIENKDVKEFTIFFGLSMVAFLCFLSLGGVSGYPSFWTGFLAFLLWGGFFASKSGSEKEK